MGKRTNLIMEVADNHGGDMELAKTFIRIAGGAGVDYVKFQSWQVSRLRDPSQEPFYDWIKNAELSDEMHYELIEECESQGVKFLTTVFDIHRVEFLASLGLEVIKVASPDASNLELLGELKDRFPHLVISTGMHDAEEIKRTAQFLEGTSFTFMHCVSLYPHDLDKANLARMVWLRQFTDSVGYSDHTHGIEAAKMAAVMGATFIERHACISPYGPGRVNEWDTTPREWEELARYVDMVDTAMGTGESVLSDREFAARERFIGRWSGAA